MKKKNKVDIFDWANVPKGDTPININTKQAIKSFYKNAYLNEISKEVVKAFELIVREDERLKMEAKRKLLEKKK